MSLISSLGSVSHCSCKAFVGMARAWGGDWEQLHIFIKHSKHTRLDSSLVIKLTIPCTELFGAEHNLLQFKPCAVWHCCPVTENYYLLRWHEGTHKHQQCHLYRCEHSQFNVGRHGVHQKRYHPKCRHCLFFHMNLFHEFLRDDSVLPYSIQINCLLLLWRLNWDSSVKRTFINWSAVM